MELLFQTKEESNQQQVEEFLKLPKTERVLHFLSMVEQFNQFPSKKKEEKSGNFNIVIHLNKR